MSLVADDRRAAFRAWLDGKKLSPYSAAKKAGISPSAIYNFIAGTSDSLSSAVMVKLAQAHGATVDEILGGKSPAMVLVTHRIGASGRMYEVDAAENLSAPVPPGAGQGDDLFAAIIDRDGLHPMPSGWAVYYRKAKDDPAALIGQLAVVRFQGGGERPVIRTIRRGSAPGLFTLQALSGALIEDVSIVSAHLVVSFSLPRP